jgi:enamine deaminase RidA (YjgF/YER057c/UK114 family)
MSPLEKLAELGYQLPQPRAAAGNYEPVTRSGNILYIAGQVSSDENGITTGRLGDTTNVVQGQNAAELCALKILAHVVHTAGVPLERIKSILKLTVYVASTPDFFEQPSVANGASNLLITVLGDRGRHARAAIGVAALPQGAAVEIDAVIEVEG